MSKAKKKQKIFEEKLHEMGSYVLEVVCVVITDPIDMFIWMKKKRGKITIS